MPEAPVYQILFNSSFLGEYNSLKLLESITAVILTYNESK